MTRMTSFALVPPRGGVPPSSLVFLFRRWRLQRSCRVAGSRLGRSAFESIRHLLKHLPRDQVECACALMSDDREGRAFCTSSTEWVQAPARCARGSRAASARAWPALVSLLPTRQCSRRRHEWQPLSRSGRPVLVLLRRPGDSVTINVSALSVPRSETLPGGLGPSEPGPFGVSARPKSSTIREGPGVMSLAGDSLPCGRVRVHGSWVRSPIDCADDVTTERRPMLT